MQVPELSPETIRRLDILFAPGDRESAKALLQQCESERLQFAALKGDVVRYVEPLFQRFTSPDEVRKGFADGTFKKHIPVEGQVWLL